MKIHQAGWSGILIRRPLPVAAVVLALGWHTLLSWSAEAPSGPPTSATMTETAVTPGKVVDKTGTNRPSTGPSSLSQLPGVLLSDPWQANQIMRPEDLARILSAGTGEKPLVVHVGPAVLWPNAHIEGSQATGPGAKPEGIQTLKHEMESLSRDKQIILYCGCCPWNSCPNIRPAFRTLQELGFKNVRILYLPKNFQQDWIAKGFPVKKG